MAEVYLNARKAAEYLGYEVGTGPRDKGLRAFYELVRRHRVTKHRIGSRLLFKQAELDAVVNRTDSEKQASAFTRMEELARADARGESRAH
jgi:hypothetical protein